MRRGNTMSENTIQELKNLVDKLHKTHTLTKEEWVRLIDGRCKEIAEYIFPLARQAREPFYHKDIYLRGLIEFTNYCKNDCYYCGIRRSNHNVNRYRLTEQEILSCCEEGWSLGFRTFVLQGGEDAYYTDEKIIHLLRMIKEHFPESAITLSIGEKTKETYQAFFDAGADRYLLRHETANEEHYSKLHPSELSGIRRKQCLRDLKEIGYEVGCGFMVGTPYQTSETLAEDMLFIKELNPAMVGIGPFISHHDTPFKDEKSGTLEDTLFFLGLLRLMLPAANLPATTALGTIHPNGRELGIEAGANVVMPNLSPTEVRKDYLLYDNKICTGDESAQCRHCLEQKMERIGYKVLKDRGDSWN